MSSVGSGALTTFVTSSSVRVKLLEHLSKAPFTPTELASLENKHVSHVSRALAELRAQGLIEPIPNQCRQKRYRATTQGLAIYAGLLKLAK
jgi:DNA-binding transcriptional ArsR family regulator